MTGPVTNPISASQITGLVLAGGRGSRMGSVDKGLQLLAGQPLVAHALARLTPQVGTVLVSANRHLDLYATLGHPVLPDSLAGQPGPLAGLLAGLDACSTLYLASVPCDSPWLPLDLVARLAAALQDGRARVAIAATRQPVTRQPVTRQPDPSQSATPQAGGALQPQPVFCLLHTSVRDSLAAFAGSGQRSVERWAAAQGGVLVVFDDAAAFVNANTLQELAALQPR